MDQRVHIQVPQKERDQGVYSCVCCKETIRNVQVNPESLPPEQVCEIQTIQDGVDLYNNLLFPGCHMATKDLRDAYLHIPIDQEFKNFLRLAVRVISKVLHFQFWALPFKLSSSPRIFTKVLQRL